MSRSAPSVRLYVLDGGLIRGYDASDLADDGASDGRLIDLPAERGARESP